MLLSGYFRNILYPAEHNDWITHAYQYVAVLEPVLCIYYSIVSLFGGFCALISGSSALK